MHGKRAPVTISRQSGFSLFEIVIVVLLIGVFMSIAIDRMLQLQVAAEKTSVQVMVGDLTSAIELQVANMVVKKGLDSMRTLENSNPMLYVQQRPANYIGYRDERDAGKLKKGSWFFDPNEGVLVYIVDNTDHFETDLPGVPRIRFQVSLVFDNDFDAEHVNTVRGVVIKPLNRYRWIFN